MTDESTVEIPVEKHLAFDPKPAAEYLAAQLAEGHLTHEDLARIVFEYQKVYGLVPDGKPGPTTLATLLRMGLMPKVYPLRVLSDLRRPVITSGFRTPSRPDHDGVDLFYRYDPTKDPPSKVGDGAATRGADGKPKWWIPPNERAIAAAAGRVSLAGDSPTGHRVWIEHGDGYRTGYFHLRSLLVTVGQNVTIATPLGECGDNPRDIDARHLHFEVSPIERYDPIDPERWLVGATYHVG